MKIKDLMGFNPEAEIKVIMPDYLAFKGTLNYGWSNHEGDTNDTSKETASEVCIFLGGLTKNIN